MRIGSGDQLGATERRTLDWWAGGRSGLSEARFVWKGLHPRARRLFEVLLASGEPVRERAGGGPSTGRPRGHGVRQRCAAACSPWSSADDTWSRPRTLLPQRLSRRPPARCSNRLGRARCDVRRRKRRCQFCGRRVSQPGGDRQAASDLAARALGLVRKRWMRSSSPPRTSATR